MENAPVFKCLDDLTISVDSLQKQISEALKLLNDIKKRLKFCNLLINFKFLYLIVNFNCKFIR